MPAGIKVVMVTGDHAATARKIALDVGLVTADTPETDADGDPAIYARVAPRDKLALVARHQARGAIVAYG